MKFTKSELEIMRVLWHEKKPLTRHEILECSKDRTWKTNSFYILINSLLNKNAISEGGMARSGKTFARQYAANITEEEYYGQTISEYETASVAEDFEVNEIDQEPIDVTEFSPDAFKDPTILLQELRQRDRKPDDIEENTNPDNYEDALVTIEQSNESHSSLEDAFWDELDHMKMSYSYKPVLLQAMMSLADVDGKAKLDQIVDYFIDFYKVRAQAGLFVEQPDSTFVQYPEDRKKARKTILIYPFKRFEEKQMMTFNQVEDTLEIVPSIWDDISKNTRRRIHAKCELNIEKYYSRYL